MEALATAPTEQLAEYPACVVCGSLKLSELAGPDRMAMEAVHRERLFRAMFPPETPGYMLKDRAYPTQVYDARLLACEECGTLARDPHLSARGSLESYAQDAYHPRWMESSYREYEAAFDQRMPELVRWVGPNARVLEVGSFVGGFLASARRRGWRAEGVDIGGCVSRFARSKGLDVHTGRLEDRCYPSRRFDAVFVWSCFDQLPQPWEQLHEIHRILDDNGRLLIRVPNGEFVKQIQRMESWAPSGAVREGLQRILALAGLAGFPHQLGYTASSLSRMLRDSGFVSVRVRNQVNVRGFVPGRKSFWSVPGATRSLRCVHAAAQLLQALTLGAVNWGPWIEVSCSKAPLTIARNELPLLCACPSFQ
jgi:SAM-dependent methyltransferase